MKIYSKNLQSRVCFIYVLPAYEGIIEIQVQLPYRSKADKEIWAVTQNIISPIKTSIGESVVFHKLLNEII